VWERHFGELPPVAHLLRRAIPERWLRIHSLPGSKRYADTEAETTELLRRHNEVAAEILGADADAALYLRLTDVEAPPWARGLERVEPDRKLVDGDEDWTVSGFRIRWRERGCDALIRDVADDRWEAVVLLNPRTGEVYAPYDGGADLFVSSRERVAELRERWAEWLSSHPLGL